MFVGFVFVLGILYGALINNCLYCFPRGESIIKTRLRCSLCGGELGSMIFIPLAGFFILRGKCTNCGQSLGWRYPLVELITGLMAVALFFRFGRATFLPALGAAGISMAGAFTDIEHGIVPDRLTLPALMTGLFLSAISPFTNLPDSITGIIVGGGVLLLIVILYPGSIGGGDIKLMAALGAWLGWRRIIIVLFLSFLLGGFGGIILVLLKKKRRCDTVVFAPFIAMAVVLTLFGWDIIGFWYFQLACRMAKL